jgi:pSer/pThr/pTyr-binding forkhead associated (FHA) protein
MELKLVYEDDDYATHEVDVTTSRFSIGRHDDNDCVIDDSNLSRRHALIENFDGAYFLSDCGSQNGTTLNGHAVSGPTQINNGDIIILGDSQEFRVKFVEPQAEEKSRPKSVSIKASTASHRNQASTVAVQQSSGLSVQTIQILIGVVAVSLVVIIGAVVIFLVGFGNGGKGNTNNQNVNIENENGEVVVENSPSSSSSPSSSPTTSQTNGNNTTPTSTPDPKLNNFEAAAKKFMLQLNTNDKVPYAFPSEKIVSTISAKAEQYRGSTQLASALKGLQSNSSSLVTKAKGNGMQPGLLIFTALALTDGGRNGDPVAKAQSIFGDLLFVQQTLGEENVDGSLIVIAGYLYGTGTKKSHPLLDPLRRLPKNTMRDRNVWFLYEHGGIKEEAYNLVITAIALGAISQNPQLYNVNAPPLTF